MKRTQFGWVFFAIIFAIAGIVIYQNHNVKTALIISIISLVLLLLFYKLTITVTGRYVQFSLGIGLIKGKYNIDNIVVCRPLSYIPFGWGIRLRPGVILFNVSGNKAIELEIKNKRRKIWIGTNCPEEIARYINSKRKNDHREDKKGDY